MYVCVKRKPRIAPMIFNLDTVIGINGVTLLLAPNAELFGQRSRTTGLLPCKIDIQNIKWLKVAPVCSLVWW